LLWFPYKNNTIGAKKGLKKSYKGYDRERHKGHGVAQRSVKAFSPGLALY